ncbi:hypothetical protein BDZ91DRAFT_735323 [Kalaharituber pfeilii]|nr:hypothetical protein BDZ91DRAFT_735323 [Kalaharituber pfeilii]
MPTILTFSRPPDSTYTIVKTKAIYNPSTSTSFDAAGIEKRFYRYCLSSCSWKILEKLWSRSGQHKIVEPCFCCTRGRNYTNFIRLYYAELAESLQRITSRTSVRPHCPEVILDLVSQSSPQWS